MSQETVTLIASSFTNILVLSSMYILVALGFAFLFNILGILNFAHGAIYMIGGYICYQLINDLGWNQWVALLASVILMGGFGLFLEKFCFRPFFGDMNKTIVVCIGIIVILETSVNITLGTEVRSIESFAQGVLKAGIFSVSAERLVTFVIGGAILSLTVWFINKTKYGQQMQAVSQNTEGAALQGINIHRIAGLACVLACGLAALAGCLMGAYLNLNPYMGDYILLKAIILVIMGGIGSVSGIFFAGLIVGALDAVLPVLINGAASSAIALGIVIIIVLFRPLGFFGREA
jgi:branched-chain amino acid transport system permease protein